jgi:hypothetical protein
MLLAAVIARSSRIKPVAIYDWYCGNQILAWTKSRNSIWIVVILKIVQGQILRLTFQMNGKFSELQHATKNLKIVSRYDIALPRNPLWWADCAMGCAACSTGARALLAR